MDKLLSVQEVAELTGLSIAKVRILCARGKIKATDTGTSKRACYFVSEGNLRSFIAGDIPKPAPIQKSKGGRPARIDRDVPKVF